MFQIDLGREGRSPLPVTLKDIARRVGRSVTTVSRALGGYDDVSPETRARVLKVAEDLGYEPNRSARQLRTRRSDTLGLILPSANPRFSDPFFSEFFTGLVEETTRHGYELLVSLGASPKEETQRYLRFLRGRRVDGFVVVRTQRQDPRIDLLREHAFPFVAFGRVEGRNDFAYIDEDSAFGIRQVVDHLVSLGHTRFAFIAEPLCFTKSHLRLQGFRAALGAHGLPVEDDRIIAGGFRQESGWKIARYLLDLPAPPTAIVTANDLLALGVLRAVRERGLQVGRDVSVTGFDDILLAEHADPPLTTVHQPARKIGSMLGEMLIGEIRGEPLQARQVILNPRLVVRQSTGPPRR
jgi:LacI family transcriptional regulator